MVVGVAWIAIWTICLRFVYGCLNCDLWDLTVIFGIWVMGCDLCGASVEGGDGAVNCDLWDLGGWAVICVVRALGAGMGGMSEL